MSTLAHIDLQELGAALRQRGLDGWLVYDFHDLNPIARRLLAARGMITRRVFLWLPAVGPPHLIVHRIDQPALAQFPGEVEVYVTWQDLQGRLSGLLRGRRVAMEMSPENAVPYLDLVPHGVVELLTRLGVTLLPSAPLVTQFSAKWSSAELEDHRQSAETIAAIARTTLEHTLGLIERATEWEVQQEVLMALNAAGLETEDPPIVAFGPNSADPHYAPEEGTSRTLGRDEVVLLDLWARSSSATVWADQTWMGFSGPTVPQEVARVWTAVIAARDAAIGRLVEASRAGQRVTGAALDQAAREVIVKQGFGEYFSHRTGHSIDLELHGSGPHLDDFETHDTRELLPGVGFSVEPGVYLPGRFGIRSEVNVVLGRSGPEVTPTEPQRVMVVIGR